MFVYVKIFLIWKLLVSPRGVRYGIFRYGILLTQPEHVGNLEVHHGKPEFINHWSIYMDR